MKNTNIYMYQHLFLSHHTNIEAVVFCFHVFIMFCVCVSGVGGNLVAVQASRISTYLHMNGLPMGDPNPTPRKCPTPCTSFFGSCKLMERSTVSLFVLCHGNKSLHDGKYPVFVLTEPILSF